MAGGGQRERAGSRKDDALKHCEIFLLLLLFSLSIIELSSAVSDRLHSMKWLNPGRSSSPCLEVAVKC